jgi:hypothetical protein
METFDVQIGQNEYIRIEIIKGEIESIKEEEMKELQDLLKKLLIQHEKKLISSTEEILKLNTIKKVKGEKIKFGFEYMKFQKGICLSFNKEKFVEKKYKDLKLVLYVERVIE